MREKKRSRSRWFRRRRRRERPPQKPPPATPKADPRAGLTGICCSGGGIRSASFNLGALQILREEGELQKAEYVSAVSGGCYIAASFATVASESDSQLLKKVPVYAPGSAEEQRLRNNSTYLAPGLGGKVRLAVRLLLGLLVNLALIALAVYLVAVPFGWILGCLYDQMATVDGEGALDVPGWLWGVLLALVAAGIAYALPDLLVRLRDRRRGFWRWLGTRDGREAWSYRLLALAALGFALLVAAPQAILWAREASGVPLDEAIGKLPWVQGSGDAEDGAGLLAAINLGAILTTVLGAVWAFVVRRRSYFALAAGAIAGPLVVLTAFLGLANLAATDAGITSLGGLAIAIAAALLLWVVSDLTQWSLHPFYRRRLSSAFFVKRVKKDGKEFAAELNYSDPFPLSKLKFRKDFFPRLIVGAAANVSDRGETPPGRAATPFVFSNGEVDGPSAEERLVDGKVGGPLVGEEPIGVYERQAERTKRDITLPAAVAMSGAAVSPVMGKKSLRALGFLMALVNVRLGVWVPNPRRLEDVREPRLARVRNAFARVRSTARVFRFLRGGGEGRAAAVWAWLAERVGRQRATPIYLFKEMLGLTRLNDRFLYVTDGGHYDNLGLIELLRRGCTTIYCFDGGGDPSGTFRALGEAVALARADLQVEIDIDPTGIAPDEKSRISKSCVAVGTIRYRVTEQGELTADREDETYTGKIVYCRTAVTKDAPWDVKAYHEKSRRFPYHSTFDQLFDDQKFEAYRALGAHAARKAVRALRRPGALRWTTEPE